MHSFLALALPLSIGSLLGDAAGLVRHYGDFDGDGFVDVYAVDPLGGDRLLRNLGDGGYADVTERAGLAGSIGTRMASSEDFDGDGRLDLYVCASSGRSRLFQNRGAVFADVTASAGVAHADGDELYAEWIDCDADGRSDLHVVTSRGDRIFRNAGGGRFAELDPSSQEGLAALSSLAGATGVSDAPRSFASTSSGCVEGLVDQSDPTNCIQASSSPELGKLMPLSRIFCVDGANVGIRTTSPTEPLDIALGDKTFQIRRDGNLTPGINLTGTGGNVGILRLRNSLEIWPDDAQTRAGWLDVRGYDGAPRCALTGATGDAWFLGNVGIGTSAPVNKLDVAGGVSVDSGDSNTGGIAGSLRFGGAASGEGILSKRDPGGNQYGLDFFAGTAVRMSITQSGDVGIGRFPSANRLEVEGDASKTTASSWLANSDRRIKTDVRELEGALETLERIRPVAFRYTDEYRAAHPSIEDQDYYNVIAQEFAEVFPDYVRDSGEHGILQVDTYPALMHAVAAVKELHDLVQRQEECMLELAREKDQRIAQLEERTARMELALSALSSGD